MKLKGRTALVTGASRGIGRAIAQVLASEGAAVAVNYRSGREKAEEVVKEITAAGGRAVALSGDVADFAQAKTLVEQTVKELGGLHILVNNAGIAKDGLIFNLEPEQLKPYEGYAVKVKVGEEAQEQVELKLVRPQQQ